MKHLLDAERHRPAAKIERLRLARRWCVVKAVACQLARYLPGGHVAGLQYSRATDGAEAEYAPERGHRPRREGVLFEVEPGCRIPGAIP